MGLCKRLGSVSDPRAVPEERSPESRSTSEVKIQLRAAAIAREVKVQQRATLARKVKVQQRGGQLYEKVFPKAFPKAFRQR